MGDETSDKIAPRQSGKEQLQERYVRDLLNFLHGQDIPFYKIIDGVRCGDLDIKVRLRMLGDKISAAHAAEARAARDCRVAENAQLELQHQLRETTLIQEELVYALGACAEYISVAAARAPKFDQRQALADAFAELMVVPHPAATTTYDVRKYLLLQGFAEVTRRLDPNEAFCSTCAGLGIVILKRVTGLAHEWIGPCDHCRAGVVKTCGYCTKPIAPYGECACADAGSARLAAAVERESARIAALPKISLADYTHPIVWCPMTSQYVKVDHLTDHIDHYMPNARPAIFFGCNPASPPAFDALDLIADLEQQARDATMLEDSEPIVQVSIEAGNELQRLLDAWAEANLTHRRLWYYNDDQIIEVPRG